MSRSVSSIPTNVPVSSGTQVVAPMYTDVAVTAGDYIYLSGTGTMGGKGATAGLGRNTTFVVASPIYGYTQTGISSPSISYSPLYDQGTFTATTRTLGAVYQTAVAVSTVTSPVGWRSCTLSNGNIAFFYSKNPSSYYISIYTPAGVQIKAETLVASVTMVVSNDALDMSAMTDGGFVVVYSNTSNQTYAQRFNSVGTNTLAQTLITTGQMQYAVSVAGLKTGGFVVSGIASSSSQLYFAIVSAANVVGGTVTVSAAASALNCRSVCLTNGNFVLVFAWGGSSTQHAIFTPSGTEVKGTTSSGIGVSPGNYSVCATDTGFAIAHTNASSGAASIQCIPSSGVIGGSTLVINTPGYLCGVTYGGTNTVYVTYQNSSNFNLAKITNTNTNPATLASTNAVTPAVTVSGTGTNPAINCLNGSIAMVYQQSTTNYLAFASANQQTYTQNVTTLTGAEYNPSTNYYFLGVAASSAAAGGTINVITNGNVTLPSTYPSVAPSISFDYQNGASPFAQRGTITGRNIALKGLE